MNLIPRSVVPTCPSLRVLSVIVKQWRSHKIWAVKQKEKTAMDAALEYFDSFYGPIYGKKWSSIRLALLSPHKYCAVVNNFGEADMLCTKLQNEGAINIREIFNACQNSLLENRKNSKRKNDLNHIYKVDKKLEEMAERTREEEMEMLYGTDINEGRNNSQEEVPDMEKEKLIKQAKLSLEQSLAEATIDRNRQIDPSEGMSSSRLNEYVPVSKLKGKEDFVSEAEHYSFYNESKEIPVKIEAEEILNFPSHLQIFTFAQGDVSAFRHPRSGLAGVQDYYLMDAGSILPVLALNLCPGDTVLDMCAAPGGKSLLCLQTLYPDSIVCNDESISRLNRLRYVMQDYVRDWEKKVTISNLSGIAVCDQNTFSKILVDVPCTNDRISATENDNNIFKSSRNKERILLPQLQVNLLFHALKLVKKGGSVVYSTCSLNPAQNDGVVHMALQRVWEETSMEIVVKDLSEALKPAMSVFKFAEPNCLRYGSLVVPYLPSNFGPMYFCKFEKKK